VPERYHLPAMTETRYEPRSYTSSPKAFGKTSRIDWKAVAPGAEVSRSAAQIQHALAWKIDQALRANGETVKSYCERTRQPYQRTAKMLNGSVIMRLEDVAAATLYLGVMPALG
jgi:hypothetical protein